MEKLERFKRFYTETVYEQIIPSEKLEIFKSLPLNKTFFEDSRDITKIFYKSKKIYNEVLYQYEQNEDSAKIKLVNIKDIEITQPFVREGLVLKMIQNIKNLPPIPAVKYGNKLVIFDGHHRLTAYWLMNKKQVKVSEVINK